MTNEPTESDSAAFAIPTPACSHVLLVEDDPTLRSFLACTLGDRGYTVVSAANVREALSLLGDRHASLAFDLVLSDVAMPGGFGTELLFSATIVERKIPVILMSAFATPELQLFVEDAGAHLLPKPFKLDSLFECILNQLRPHFRTPSEMRQP